MVDKTLLRKSERRPVMSDSLQPQGLILAWVAGFPSPGDLPNPGIEPKSPALQVDSSPAEPQGKPKNTGLGSLSLLQRIFPTQESNRGLLRCRQILYQPSCQGSQEPFFSNVSRSAFQDHKDSQFLGRVHTERMLCSAGHCFKDPGFSGLTEQPVADRISLRLGKNAG